MVRIKHRYIVCRLQCQYYEARPDFSSIRSSDILKSIRTEFQLLLRVCDLDLDPSPSSRKRKRSGGTCSYSTKKMEEEKEKKKKKKKKSDEATDSDLLDFPKKEENEDDDDEKEEEEAFIGLVPQQAVVEVDKEAERALLDSIQVTFYDPKDSQVFVVRCLRDHISLLRQAVGKVASVKKGSMSIESFIVAGSARTCEKKLQSVLTMAKGSKINSN